MLGEELEEDAEIINTNEEKEEALADGTALFLFAMLANGNVINEFLFCLKRMKWKSKWTRT